jgi:hypothetical protein
MRQLGELLQSQPGIALARSEHRVAKHVALPLPACRRSSALHRPGSQATLRFSNFFLVSRIVASSPADHLSASRNSLQSYELSRLAHVANLRKEIGALLDQWMEENACAMLARSRTHSG